MRKLFILATILFISTSLTFAQKGSSKTLDDPSSSSKKVNTESQFNLFSGTTTVRLSSDFVGALGALEITPDRIFPSRINRGNVVFPIIAGNLETNTLRGEILHSGGLTLTKGSTTVKLQNFIIDTTGEGFILTGNVSANGTVVGRIPLFDLQLASNLQNDIFAFDIIRLNDVIITLRPEAAGALNGVFATEAFVPGFSIGTGFVRGLAFVD
jgi:hypothetical protein